jgi:predicted RNase H-related nuclease YkuK (DUF458 family)
MFSNKKLAEAKAFIEQQSEQSKIYIGCDSEVRVTKRGRFADFYLVVVIHIDQSHGCKIFGEKFTEQDFTTDKKRPTHRLMKEVYKASELYLQLADSIGNREVEIHLDINKDERHASNLVLDQAIGYIKGTCNIVPMVKPESWCATHVADKFLKVANGR